MTLTEILISQGLPLLLTLLAALASAAIAAWSKKTLADDKRSAVAGALASIGAKASLVVAAFEQRERAIVRGVLEDGKLTAAEAAELKARAFADLLSLATADLATLQKSGGFTEEQAATLAGHAVEQAVYKLKAERSPQLGQLTAVTAAGLVVPIQAK